MILDPELPKQILQGTRAALEKHQLPAFIFDRVSSAGQEYGFSLVNQEDSAARYCREKNLYIVQAFTISESAWARKKKRKEFRRMISLARQYGIKHLVFKNTDRYARNYADLVLLEQLIDNEEFHLHFYQNNRLLNKKSNHNDRMILGIDITVAKYTSDKISNDIREMNQFKASRGIAPTGPTPPIGYVYDKSIKRHLIDRDRESFMRWFFDEFDHGRMSLIEFTRHVNDRGYRTVTGRPWQTSRIHAVLHNPFYHGEFMYHGELYQGTQEPYYEKERYTARLQRLSDGYYPRKDARPQFNLNSIMKCSCGRAIYGDRPKGKYTYYIHKCLYLHGRQASFAEDDIFQQIDTAVLALPFDDELARQLLDIFRDQMELRTSNIQPEIRKCSADISQLAVKKQRILDLYASGAMNDVAALKNQVEFYNSQIRELEEKKLVLMETRDDTLVQIAGVMNRLKDFPRIYLQSLKEDKGRLIRTFAERIIVDETGRVSLIEWRMPYRILFRQGLAEEVRVYDAMHARRESNPRPTA